MFLATFRKYSASMWRSSRPTSRWKSAFHWNYVCSSTTTHKQGSERGVHKVREENIQSKKGFLLDEINNLRLANLSDVLEPDMTYSKRILAYFANSI